MHIYSTVPACFAGGLALTKKGGKMLRIDEEVSLKIMFQVSSSMSWTAGCMPCFALVSIPCLLLLLSRGLELQLELDESF